MTNNNEVITVFVYGILRMHESNHSLLAGSRRISSQCYTIGRLYDTGYGFPAMTQEQGNRVYGEMYGVTPEILARFDALEGYYGEGENNHYTRVMQSIQSDIGEMEAFVYVYPGEETEGLHCIEHGDWKYHKLILQSDKPWIYFAYGSCMDDERFKFNGQDHLFEDVLGRGVLDGYSLKFTRKAADGGKADIMEFGGVVEGKVYRIGQEALEHLLVREGVARSIYRPTFVDIRVGDTVVTDALTFVVIDKAECEVFPPENYLAEIRRGGKTVWSAEHERRFEEQIKNFECDIIKASKIDTPV